MVKPASANKCEDFQKCGDITTAIGVGQKVYALNCMFCGTICLQLETFAMHIEENHQSELNTRFCVDHEPENFRSQTNIECLPNTPNVDMSEEDDENETNDRNLVNHTVIAALEHADPLAESHVRKATSLSPVNDEDDLSQSGVSESDDAEDEYDDTLKDDHFKPESTDNETDIENTSLVKAADVDTNNKELIIAIIEDYEKIRYLWNEKEQLSKTRRQCEEAYMQIAKSVNRKLDLQYNWKAIRKYILKIRREFRNEWYSNQDPKQIISKRHIPLWYYDRLSFLIPSMTNDEPPKRYMKVGSKRELVLPLTDLSESQNLQFVEILESFPCLWNEDKFEFRYRNKRKEALNEMVETVNDKMKLNVTPEELQKRISRIRYAGTKEKRRKLECERLKKDYKPSSGYYDKIAFLNDHIGPFQCDLCATTCTTLDKYKIHKSEHDGTMPFICPFCNRGFKSIGNCTTHLRRHKSDLMYECDDCKKFFATSTDLKIHQRLHTGEKPYFCEICGQSFRSHAVLSRHLRRHKKILSHKCMICPKAFYDNDRLREHMKVHLNIRDRICNICGKAFTTRKYLLQHKQIHAEKKQYKCKICSKEFAQYSGLSGHMKTHGTTVSGAFVGS